LGVQSLRDDDLKFLGRQHSASCAMEAIYKSKEIFNRVSIDLIYGRQNQTEEEWKVELRKALSFQTGHISLYNLTVEKGTKLHNWVQERKVILPDENVLSGLYDTSIEETSKLGYEHYEISNFAQKGHQSQHNMNYWMGGDYIGIGPGAASRLTTLKNGKFQKETFVQIKHPKKWIDSVNRNGIGYDERIILSTEQQLMELIMMALRTKEGLLFNEQFDQLRNGKRISEIFDEKQLYKYIQEGYIFWNKEQMQATSTGRKILDSLLPSILL